MRIAAAWLAALLFSADARAMTGKPWTGKPWTEKPWSAGGLHGTLTHPAGVARGPAVLIIAGSGPTDRDGNGPALSTDTYKLLAQGFAAQGIHVLRYDKRGIGDSRALMPREDDARFSLFVDDAVAASRALSARADVSSVVIAGHSEGALIALLAAQRTRVAGVILLTATGRPLAAVLRKQLQSALSGPLQDEALRLLDRLAAGERVADVRPELAALFRPSVQPYLMSLMAIDPAAELARLNVPVLLIHAEHDLQISRGDFDALRGARANIRTVLLPQANHVLKTAPADRARNIAVYQDRTAPLDPGVMPPLVAFVRDVTR
jgi:pimeloyl-ACP methyl ester carboxylesterase